MAVDTAKKYDEHAKSEQTKWEQSWSCCLYTSVVEVHDAASAYVEHMRAKAVADDGAILSQNYYTLHASVHSLYTCLTTANKRAIPLAMNTLSVGPLVLSVMEVVHNLRDIPGNFTQRNTVARAFQQFASTSAQFLNMGLQLINIFTAGIRHSRPAATSRQLPAGIEHGSVKQDGTDCISRNDDTAAFRRIDNTTTRSARPDMPGRDPAGAHHLGRLLAEVENLGQLASGDCSVGADLFAEFDKCAHTATGCDKASAASQLNYKVEFGCTDTSGAFDTKLPTHSKVPQKSYRALQAEEETLSLRDTAAALLDTAPFLDEYFLIASVRASRVALDDYNDMSTLLSSLGLMALEEMLNLCTDLIEHSTPFGSPVHTAALCETCPNRWPWHDPKWDSVKVVSAALVNRSKLGILPGMHAGPFDHTKAWLFKHLRHSG